MHRPPPPHTHRHSVYTAVHEPQTVEAETDVIVSQLLMETGDIYMYSIADKLTLAKHPLRSSDDWQIFGSHASPLLRSLFLSLYLCVCTQEDAQ